MQAIVQHRYGSPDVLTLREVDRPVPAEGQVLVRVHAASVFFGVPPVIPFDWALIGLILCSVIGVVFGTYPAIRAARLSPIDAIIRE